MEGAFVDQVGDLSRAARPERNNMLFVQTKSGCCGPSALQSARGSFTESEVEHAIPVDVLEGKAGGYSVRASLPGFARENVEVSFSEGILSIRASRRETAPEGEVEYLLRERTQGLFSRRIKLPKASGEGVKAELKDGVLTVTLQREAEQQLRTINIEQG